MLGEVRNDVESGTVAVRRAGQALPKVFPPLMVNMMPGR